MDLLQRLHQKMSAFGHLQVVGATSTNINIGASSPFQEPPCTLALAPLNRPYVNFPSLPPPHTALYTAPATMLDMSMDSLVALSKQLAEENNIQSNSFEIVAAHVWRERARALCSPLPSHVRLFFLATSVSTSTSTDCCDTTMPKVYYGLHAFKVQVVACPSDLFSNPLSYTLKLLLDAKAALVENFPKCLTDFSEVFQPYAYPNLGNIFVTELSSKVNNSFDYGCGNMACLDPLGDFGQVNAAGVFHCVNNYDHVYIAMNNVPSGVCEQLKHNFNAVTRSEAKCKL